MQLEQVSKSTWAIVDGSTYGNVGCIQIPNHLVIIDTGMTPKLAEEFRNLIHKEIGKPITEVILTHYHSDHVFGAQEFQEYPLIASTKMVERYPTLLKAEWSSKGINEMRKFYAETEPDFSRQLENLTIITPTKTFKNSLFLGNEKEIEIQHTGGHTVGHSTVYFHPEDILFAGDLVFCQQYPYAGDPTNNPPDWIKAFETILEMPVDTIVPGHGPLCDKEEIQTQLTYFKQLEKWVKGKLAQGITLDAIRTEEDTGPIPPSDVKAERRLPATIERWFNYYSAEMKRG
jgi:glyoxylase-like metal-dependent hydrolase (beta-lactamase superfamily II)